jgi:hypothetical protein
MTANRVLTAKQECSNIPKFAICAQDSSIELEMKGKAIKFQWILLVVAVPWLTRWSDTVSLVFEVVTERGIPD